jgi:hypothetical protein
MDPVYPNILYSKVVCESAEACSISSQTAGECPTTIPDLIAEAVAR